MAKKLAVLQAVLIAMLAVALAAFAVVLWLYLSGRAEPQTYYDARFVRGVYESGARP